MRATNPRRPVRPVAEVSTWGGVRVRLRDDWTWALAPGSRRPAGVVALMLADLGAIGRVGEGVANLADTARAGAGTLPGGEIVRWWGGHEDDRDRALQRLVRRGGPVPCGGRG